MTMKPELRPRRGNSSHIANTLPAIRNLIAIPGSCEVTLDDQNIHAASCIQLSLSTLSEVLSWNLTPLYTSYAVLPSQSSSAFFGTMVAVLLPRGNDGERDPFFCYLAPVLIIAMEISYKRQFSRVSKPHLELKPPPCLLAQESSRT